MAKTTLIAHRGLSAAAPENTLAAFRAAAAAGISWIETDVDITADGTVLVCHDITGDRTTSHAGPLYSLTRADAARIDAGSWFGPEFAGEPLPTLEQLVEVVDQCGLGVNIELKPSQRTAADSRALVDACLEQAGSLGDRLLLSSFNPLLLDYAHRTRAQANIALLIDAAGLQLGWPGIVDWIGAQTIHPDHQALTPALVEAFHAARLRVNAWTVNTRQRAHELLNWGVDGIISDCPDTLADLVD